MSDEDESGKDDNMVFVFKDGKCMVMTKEEEQLEKEMERLELEQELAEEHLLEELDSGVKGKLQTMKASLLAFMMGTRDRNSPVSWLSGQADVMSLIAKTARAHQWSDVLAAHRAAVDNSRGGPRTRYDSTTAGVALAHVAMVEFPPLPALKHERVNVNMMPFVMNDMSTLPEQLHRYWPLVLQCTRALSEQEAAKVGYITVHEADVQPSTSQRRPGLHTEGFNAHTGTPGSTDRCARRLANQGKCVDEPWWHHWGFGHAMRSGTFEGGIFMASTLTDSCHAWDIAVPSCLVGGLGDIEHLRPALDGLFPGPAQGRELHSNGNPAETYHRYHEGFPAPPPHPISMRAGELWWMTDRTPHESMPVSEPCVRQYFRLVTSRVDVWYAQHSTANPLGVKPAARIVHHNKFDLEQADDAQIGPAAASAAAEGGSEGGGGDAVVA